MVDPTTLPGDYLIIRNNSNVDTIPNTGGGDLLLLYDKVVKKVGHPAGLVYTAGTFTLGATGHYLVLVSERVTNGQARINYKTTLTLAGSELKAGYSTGYLRHTTGQDTHITQACVIINVTTTTGNGDELQVRTERTDSITSVPLPNREGGESCITIIKLDDAHNYARYESSALRASSVTDNERVLANIQTNLEQDSPFTRTTDTVDIATNNMVLAVYTLQMEETTGGTLRQEWQGDLQLAGTSVPGSVTTIYIRTQDDTDWGAASIGVLLDPTSGDDLTLGLTTREDGGLNFLATLELWELPVGAETAIMEATTGDYNLSNTRFVWDTLPQIDTAAFTATAGTDTISVDNPPPSHTFIERESYLAFAAVADFTDAGTVAVRAEPACRWSLDNAVNGAVFPGASSGFHRGTLTADHSSIGMAGLVPDRFSGNGGIQMNCNRIATDATAINCSNGAMSVIRMESIFGVERRTRRIFSTS